MGIIRRFLFRVIYPIPQKKEDLISHKETFIEEYVEPYRIGLEIKGLITPRKKRESVCYAKNKHDKLQRKHAEAYKIWQKVASMKQRLRG